MKRSAAKSLPQKNLLDITDRHYIYDLVDTLNSFFRNHFDGAVKFESLIEHPFYIDFDGSKFSEFLNYALSFGMGEKVLHIYLRQLEDELNILIGAKDDLKIDESFEAELRRLAEGIGFSIAIRDNTLIASKKVNFSNAVPMNAIKPQAPLYDQLYCAFFGDKERDQ